MEPAKSVAPDSVQKARSCGIQATTMEWDEDLTENQHGATGSEPSYATTSVGCQLSSFSTFVGTVFMLEGDYK